MDRLSTPRPLDPGDNREIFDCGRESLNQWLRRHAWRNQQAGTSRTNVILDRQSETIAGYVTLCAGEILRAYLPKSGQRNQPDPVPVILLGQLAVDLRHQRRGVARSLL